MPIDLNSLAADLQAQCDAIEAVLGKVEDEGRAATTEETEQVKTLETARDDLQARIDSTQASRERRSRNRTVREGIATRRLPRLTQSPDLGDPGDRRAPAIHRLHEPLRNFTGEDALDRAHLSGQFFLAALWRRPRAIQWCERNGIPVEWSADPDRDEGLAMSGAQNTAGGYLVPTPLAQTIIDLRQRYGVFRANARVWPMTSDVENIPRRTGGVTAYFVGDNQEITASDKAWDQVSLTARKLGVLCKYSSEISEDAVLNIADDLAGEIALAFAYKEDLCGFSGDGTLTYGGIKGLLNAIGAGSTNTCGAAGTQTLFGNITQASLEGAIGMLPEYPGIQPAWFFSKAGWAASIKRLVDAAAAPPRPTWSTGFSAVNTWAIPW